MNFKALVAATAVSVASVFGAPAPEAHAGNCTYGSGFEICYSFEGNNIRNNEVWLVRLRNNHITERMIVECDGKRMYQWRSQGGASRSEAAYLARTFCAL